MAETTTSATIIDHRRTPAEHRAGRPASLVELGAGAGTAGGGVVVKYPALTHTNRQKGSGARNKANNNNARGPNFKDRCHVR